MSNSLLDSLTATQRAAVEHIDGPLLILAGPGSGKTRVVTHRIANLLQHGIPARQILALTFTNKAADEMRIRLQRVMPRQPVWMGTFHRFCAFLLRQHAALVGLHENYSILDMDDSRKALAEAIEDAKIELTHTTPESIASEISAAKNSLITHDQYKPRRGSHAGPLVSVIYPAYQKRLLAANAVDFDDLLMHVAIMLRENPELRRSLDERYRYILVDEYQDTNLAQYAIVRALSIDHPNLAVTGDPDQSIYGWRGANLNNILDFEHDFPQVHVVRLEQNYRSTKSILSVAQHLISHNIKRKEKNLFTENAQGRPVRLVEFSNQRDEAEGIANAIAAEVHAERRRPRDFAIFYRTNALSRQLEHALREHGLPYQIIHGVEFYQRKEIKDVVAYLHLLNNPQNDIAFLRIINTPARSIGKSTVAKLSAHARRYSGTLLEAAREAGLIEGLAQRSALAVAKFVSLYDRLRVHATEPVEQILRAVLTESGYRQQLEDSDAEEDVERLANIEELLTAAREFDEQNPGDGQLEKFLEQAALVADTDDLDTETDKVTLMTLHAAKGLEFPVVFIVALEHGLLPHERNKDDADKMEEERRLLFVGITRAEEELQLSLAQYRSFRGEGRPTVPSSFLMELPRGEMEIVEAPRHAWSGAPWQKHAEADDVHEVWSDDAYLDEPQPKRSGLRSTSPDEMLDESFGDDMPKPSSKAKKAADNEPRFTKMMTAAEMLEAETVSAMRISPDTFSQGMVVTHSEYGSGVITTLSGSGTKRTATVRFHGSAGQKTFRLAYSGLKPVRSSE